MKRIFVAAVVVVIALAFVTALLIPTPAGICYHQNKGKGKTLTCHANPANPPPCPPCQVWDQCICGCRNIPGCPPDPSGEPLPSSTKG
jgi:hypothetical protein